MALGQGGADVFRIAFNLDEARPVPREVDEQGNVGGSFFLRRELELSKGDRDTIWVPVSVSKYSVRFRLRLSYLVGEDRNPQQVMLDDGGRPFAITAINCVNGRRVYQRIYSSQSPDLGSVQGRMRQVPNPQKYWTPSPSPCSHDFASTIKSLMQLAG
jgi:hypothetical protein